jgi:hypothetical protein
MKTTVIVAALAAILFCISTPAYGWHCTDPLAERVQVAPNTTGVFGDADGQLANYGGEVWECEVVKPTPPTPPTTTPSTSTSSASSAANSSSNSNSSSNQTQGQKQSQTANGGSATSSVSKSGNSTLKNVGNSSNANTNTATGGNQSQSSSATATGNGDNSNNYENFTNVPRDTATAVAPTVLPTVPCFKGIGAGIQGPAFGASFGGGKIDANCAELEASRLAPSLIARCKVYIMNKYVRAAGVTLDDCMHQNTVSVAVAAPVAPPAPIIVPAPVVTVNIAPPAVVQAPVAPPSVVVAAKKTVAHRQHIPCEPTTVPSGKKGCVVTNDSISK